MSQTTMRGMRLGSQSLESETNVRYETREKYEYQCPAGHLNELVFAANAEVPQVWECRTCAREAQLVKNGEPLTVQLDEEKTGRSHWQMLLERRSLEELEEILQERLDYLKARRAGGKVDF